MNRWEIRTVRECLVSVCLSVCVYGDISCWRVGSIGNRNSGVAVASPCQGRGEREGKHGMKRFYFPVVLNSCLVSLFGYYGCSSGCFIGDYVCFPLL